MRRAAAAEALDNYRQTLVQAFAEVEDALVQERQQRAFVASVDKQLRLSTLAIGRLRESYRNGAVDYLRTEAARDLEPILDAMGKWAYRHTDAEDQLCWLDPK